MAKELFEKGVFLYITAGVAGIGILLRLILSMVYRRLVGASEHMGKTKNKWASQLKKRFETCYQLKIGVKNVDIFVDKYVYKQKFCGILLSTWELISGQLKYLCLLAASIGGIVGLVTECGKNEILFTFFTGFWTAALLMIVDNMSGLKGKKQIIRLNLKDYLENFLKVRYENPDEYEAIQKEFAYSKEAQAAPSRKERRRLAKLEKQQEKLEKKQAKTRGKEQKKFLAEQKKREAEERVFAEMEAQRLLKEKKKAEAAERRRQQLIKMEGAMQDADWGMPSQASQIEDMPENMPAAEPVDFTKAAAVKTEALKNTPAQETGKQANREAVSKKAADAPKDVNRKNAKNQKKGMNEAGQAAQMQEDRNRIQAPEAGEDQEEIARAQIAAAQAPVPERTNAAMKSLDKNKSAAEDKLIADVLKEFLS